MIIWTADDVRRLTGPQEVRLSTQRSDGTLRPPRTIWIVAVYDRAYIRSTNGRQATWFRGALSTMAGNINADGITYPVNFSETPDEDLPAVDQAYRHKYGSYRSIVDHLLEPRPRAATLEVHHRVERGER
jgi:hypothetical protein